MSETNQNSQKTAAEESQWYSTTSNQSQFECRYKGSWLTQKRQTFFMFWQEKKQETCFAWNFTENICPTTLTSSRLYLWPRHNVADERESRHWSIWSLERKFRFICITNDFVTIFGQKKKARFDAGHDKQWKANSSWRVERWGRSAENIKFHRLTPLSRVLNLVENEVAHFKESENLLDGYKSRFYDLFKLCGTEKKPKAIKCRPRAPAIKSWTDTVSIARLQSNFFFRILCLFVEVLQKRFQFRPLET